VISGNTATHPADHGLSCSLSGVATGSEIAYQLTAARSGVLDVLLTTEARLGVEVRTGCTDPTTALACTLNRRIITPISQNQSVFVVVDGIESTSSGPFTLDVRTRSTVCGDGNRDPGEACDDGGIQAGDGCDPSCVLESSESEPNDTTAQADDFVSPFFGSIASSGDADLVRVTLARAASIVADVGDFGDDACEHRLLDSVVEILASDGSTLLAFDDDAGVGLCSHAVLTTQPAGTYYVRVSAASGVPLFPYVLRIVVDDCGNGNKSEGEACDDGNSVPFDGCDPSCKLE
jgi:cysteine-rich repeat protein